MAARFKIPTLIKNPKKDANECMNRLIKKEEDPKFSKKQVALLLYIERIRAEIKSQQDEQFLAVFGRGQYRVTKEFSSCT